MKSLYFSATLRGTPAPVWRHFTVPMTYTFSDLHEVMQILFGYSNNHPFEFVFEEQKLRVTADYELYKQYQYFQTKEGKHYLEHMKEDGHEVDNSVVVALAEDLPLDPITLKHNDFLYIYDFEDDWTYDVKLMNILEDGEPYPTIEEGIGTAPFQDCGGEDGYYEMIEALTDPKHPDNEAVHLWVDTMGYHFFDKDEANEALQMMAADKAE